MTMADNNHYKLLRFLLSPIIHCKYTWAIVQKDSVALNEELQKYEVCDSQKPLLESWLNKPEPTQSDNAVYF